METEKRAQLAAGFGWDKGGGVPLSNARAFDGFQLCFGGL